jgi:hypothetical protein
MGMRSIAFARLLTAAGPAALFGSGDTQQLSHTIEANGATSARAGISMATGRLTVRGGAAALMDGEFTYGPELEPQFSYAVHDGRGELRVEQPRNRGERLFRRSGRNEWELRFNNDLPLELDLSVASGDCRLDGRSLNLTVLDVESKSGNCELDLRGAKPELRTLDVRLTSGGLRLSLAGDYSQPLDATVSTASGDIELDLRGGWHANATVRVRVTSGDAVVRVPTNVAVQARARTISGDVRASGLERSGSGFVNNLAGVAAVGLTIEVETVSGDVRLDAS